MPEIRKDYVTNSWVVIAMERGQRPQEFKKTTKPDTNPEDCPFCPGKESMTPPEILAYRAADTKPNTQGWWVRCVANKYPALRIEGEVNPRLSQLLCKMNGVGAHEVIIEIPDHNLNLATVSDWQVSEMLNAYRDRYRDLTNDTRFKYILIFKNHGDEAGASLFHPHSQLIATPMIPRRIMDELESSRHYHFMLGGGCIYDDIIKEEKAIGERIVMESDNFIAISPYAARFPFEIWLLPKKHQPYFENINDSEKNEFGKFLKDVLKKLYDKLGNPPYNYFIHTSPCDRNDYRFYHWHIEITPRLVRAAGFERGTGFYINPVSPEDAAKYLREEAT
ncbi:MAG: galactose-1-phosphate uridylyltransferase [Candidatus Thermoplasmatota archaeon]